MSAYSTAVLAATPSLYWRLGETSGTNAADSSGNSRNGTYGAGCTLNQTGAMPTYDSAAPSVLFGNSTTGVITSSYAAFPQGSKRTFMGWANRAATTDFDTIFGGSTLGLFLSSAAETVNWRPDGLHSVAWGGANAWPGTAQWVHWALTYDDTALLAELFLNGSSKGQLSVTSGQGYPASGGNFTAGASGTLNPWNGNQQDVAVFPTILSAAEILSIYQAGTQASPAATKLAQKTASGGLPVMQKAATGYSYVSQKSGLNVPIAQKPIAGWTYGKQA